MSETDSDSDTACRANGVQKQRRRPHGSSGEKQNSFVTRDDAAVLPLSQTDGFSLRSNCEEMIFNHILNDCIKSISALAAVSVLCREQQTAGNLRLGNPTSCFTNKSPYIYFIL